MDEFDGLRGIDMDAFRFINSKDIRNYLNEINYTFTPVEMAWLIWKCEHITLKEKQDAWQDIIDTLPDCPVDCSFQKISSLHKFLKDTITLENKMIDDFCKNEKDTVYYFYIDYTRGYDHNHKKYSTYDDMIEDVKNIVENPKRKICYFHFCKEYSNENKTEYDFNVYPNLEIKSISNAELHDKRNTIFMDLDISVPTPFKQGDVVCFPNAYADCDRSPKVVTFEEKVISENESIPVYEQVSFSSGKIKLHYIWDYMDLEYYNGDFDGKKRIIKLLSNYLKGKIDTALFATAYHYYLTEHYFNRILKTDEHIHKLPDEALILVGLKEEEE